MRLGDASLVSPFTSKSVSVDATLHIIRQGRCTLVTTIQMLKILALNCLVTAYALSVLFLNGVKQGDGQATAAGLVIAVVFMLISWSKPLETLSSQRPVTSIFDSSVIVSLIGQFAVHFAALQYAVRACDEYVDPDADEMSPDGDFKPNVINTVVFALLLNIQLSVFACNYRGEPFMQSLQDNVPLHRTLAVAWVLNIASVAGIIPGLGELMEFVSLEQSLALKVAACIVVDTVASFAWEVGICRKLFANA